MAASSQALPVGDGKIVLDAVIDHLASLSAGSMLDAAAVKAVGDDLIARAEMGEKKYGTKLRTNNGRKVLVDLYQESLDGLMYAMQGRLERDDYAAVFISTFTNVCCLLAAELNRRG
jgi:hypothetical protein